MTESEALALRLATEAALAAREVFAARGVEPSHAEALDLSRAITRLVAALMFLAEGEPQPGDLAAAARDLGARLADALRPAAPPLVQ